MSPRPVQGCVASRDRTALGCKPLLEGLGEAQELLPPSLILQNRVRPLVRPAVTAVAMPPCENMVGLPGSHWDLRLGPYPESCFATYSRKGPMASRVAGEKDRKGCQACHVPT